MARTWAILDYVSIEHVFSLFHPQFTAIHSFGAKEFWEISGDEVSRQCRGSQSLAQPDFGHYQDEWLDVLLQKKGWGGGWGANPSYDSSNYR